jgi:predicted RNase H-like nuclease
MADALSRARQRNGRVKLIAEHMDERQLENRIRKIVRDLRELGFLLLAYHTYRSEKSPEGFPDWVYASMHGQMYRELKKEHEEPTRAQQEWLMILQAGGADARVWRPSDLIRGDIGHELAVLAGALPGRREETP